MEGLLVHLRTYVCMYMFTEGVFVSVNISCIRLYMYVHLYIHANKKCVFMYIRTYMYVRMLILILSYHILHTYYTIQYNK